MVFGEELVNGKSERNKYEVGIFKKKDHREMMSKKL